MLRGLRAQPHAEHCRRQECQVEAQGERGRKVNEEKQEEDVEDQGGKRRKLNKIEQDAMMEEDPTMLARLFEEYREEYEKLENEKKVQGGKRRKLNEIERGAMMEEDPTKLARLFEEYRGECEKQDNDKKRRKREQDKGEGDRTEVLMELRGDGEECQKRERNHEGMTRWRVRSGRAT